MKCRFQFCSSQRLKTWLVSMDRDEMTSPFTFGKVTWPSLHSMGRSVFYRQLFSAYHRLFCKVTNLWEINLNFSVSIPDVNIYKTAKLRDVSMPKSCISKNRVFRNSVIYSLDKVCQFFSFRAYLCIPTYGKNVIVTSVVVSEILEHVWLHLPRCH